MTKISTAFLLTATLLLALCSPKQVSADVVTTLAAAKADVLKAYPELAGKYQTLQDYAGQIDTAIQAADSVKSRDLLRAFLPVFDEVLNKLADKQRLFALVDIAVHLLINHLPADVVTNVPRERRTVQRPDAIDDYRNRAAWGCQYVKDAAKKYGEVCHN